MYLSTGFDNASLLAVKVEKHGDGFAATVAWRTNKKAPKNASPLLVGGELYTVSDDGFATCYDAETGKAHWQERVPGEYTASPAFAAGKIYLQNETGVGTVLKAGPAFEVLATNDLKGPDAGQLRRGRRRLPDPHREPPVPSRQVTAG